MLRQGCKWFWMRLLVLILTLAVLHYGIKIMHEEQNNDIEKLFLQAIQTPIPPTKMKNVRTAKTMERVNRKSCEQGINCHLPNCLCFGIPNYPRHLNRSQVPQMVVFASDDSLNKVYANYYRQIFGNHKNPNGCPYTGTMFLSDSDGQTFISNTEYLSTPLKHDTNYTLVKEFYEMGWEISQHGFQHIEHRFPDVLREDIARMTDYTHIKSGIPKEHLNQGWRSPYLLSIGRGEIETVPSFGIQYSINFGSDLHGWPFTLDYQWEERRNLGTRRGFWIFPMASYPAKPFLTYDTMYIDDAAITREDVRLNSESEINRILNEAFDNHYHGDRSIFIINTHGSLSYRNPRALPAMVKFFKRLSKLNDVFVVSAIKALQWVKDPMPLEHMNDFKPWRC